MWDDRPQMDTYVNNIWQHCIKLQAGEIHKTVTEVDRHFHDNFSGTTKEEQKYDASAHDLHKMRGNFVCDDRIS